MYEHSDLYIKQQYLRTDTRVLIFVAVPCPRMQSEFRTVGAPEFKSPYVPQESIVEYPVFRCKDTENPRFSGRGEGDNRRNRLVTVWQSATDEE